MHRDDRGVFIEVFRREWRLGIEPVQWNVASSEAGSPSWGPRPSPPRRLPGTSGQGRASVGLQDLRRGSATQGLAALVELAADDLRGVFIPHGVAHGFLFPRAVDPPVRGEPLLGPRGREGLFVVGSRARNSVAGGYRPGLRPRRRRAASQPPPRRARVRATHLTRDPTTGASSSQPRILQVREPVIHSSSR